MLKNSHPRDSQIRFEEGPHIYYINGDPSYTSVTTWCHKHFEKFDADAIIDKMMASKRWPKSKYFGQTKDEIKALWNKNGKEASEAGTKLHYDIECFYNGVPNENDSVEYKYFLDYHEKMTEGLKPYRTEWTVFHEGLKIAGSIDMIYENEKGELIIADWKRCKEIKKTNRWRSSHTECISHLPDSNFWHYALQLNTYRKILEEKYDKKIVDMFLVRLHPNAQKWEKVKIPFLESEMADLIKHRKNELKNVFSL